MAETIRELILQDIEGVLESRYDNIYRGRTQLEYGDLPCADLLPGMESAERVYGEQRITLPISIYALQIIEDEDVGALAEVLLGQLISDIVGNKDNIGYISDMQYSSGGVDTWPEQNEQALSVQIDIEILYSTNIGDPYNQKTI